MIDKDHFWEILPLLELIEIIKNSIDAYCPTILIESFSSDKIDTKSVNSLLKNDYTLRFIHKYYYNISREYIPERLIWWMLEVKNRLEKLEELKIAKQMTIKDTWEINSLYALGSYISGSIALIDDIIEEIDNNQKRGVAK